MSRRITHTVGLNASSVRLQGKRVLKGEDELDATLRKAYRDRVGDHRKFYRMDRMSKAGFLCAELLMENSGLLQRYREDRIGIVLANSASSLDTDRDHQASIEGAEGGSPSPGIFVHTLPNIAIGEICIRHGIMGENAFFIFDGFAPGALKKRVEDLFLLNRVDACIGGWLEKDGERAEAFLYSVEEEDASFESSSSPHTEEGLRTSFDKSMERK